LVGLASFARTEGEWGLHLKLLEAVQKIFFFKSQQIVLLFLCSKALQLIKFIVLLHFSLFEVVSRWLRPDCIVKRLGI